MKTLRKLLLLNYVVNLRSKEIHRVGYEHRNCHIDRVVCKVYVWNIVARILCRYYGYNGCYWCFRELDTDR
jgi:hypothetical protein